MTHAPGAYEAIVVGGGHHGLVSAAYPARPATAALADARSARRSPRRVLGRPAR